VRAATPFLLDEFSLRLAALPEVLFRVADGLEPESVLTTNDLPFFERRLSGGKLVFPTASNSEILRKATQLSLDNRVRLSEPNFIIEGMGGDSADKASRFAIPRVFVNDCGPTPVQLRIFQSGENSFGGTFAHLTGELIILEIAPDLTGPWALLVWFENAQTGTFTLPEGANHSFVRAFHR
jgi:hypothetical protein